MQPSLRTQQIADLFTAVVCAVISAVGISISIFRIRGSWDPRHEWIGILATLAIGSAITAALSSPGLREAAAARVRPAVAAGLILLAASVCASGLLGSATAFVWALAAIAGFACLSFWRPLLFAVAPAMALLFAAVLLPEWPPRATWGDLHTFAYAFPRRPPYIGPGGRLRPKQALRVAVANSHGASYRFEVNSFGFRNRAETTRDKPPGVYRVLSLGDSFSVGYGVDQDRFLGAVLESELTSRGGAVEVLNAEVSDPAYGLFYLQQEGVTFTPDVVIYGLCGNDPVQTFLATAENSLFTVEDDGSVRTNPGADSTRHRETFSDWQRIVYRTPGTRAGRLNGRLRTIRGLRAVAALRGLLPSSRRERGGELTPNSGGPDAGWRGHMKLFDGYNNLGNLGQDRLEPSEIMYAHLFRALTAMNSIALDHDAEFLLLLYPTRLQVQPQDWRAVVDHWQLDPAEFDLDKHHRRIVEFCAEAGIRCLDLAPSLRRRAESTNLYLSFDEHLSEAGHAAAAEQVASYLVDELSYATPP